MLEAPIKHGKLLTVIVLITCVLGIAAARLIPVQMIPDLDVRSISVVTRWSGATPQDVEKEILIEQERYLRNIPNLARMESTAETGSASVELEFPFGVDINETLIEVSNALSQVPSYPLNVDEPSIRSSSFSENPFMYFEIMPLPGNPLQLDLDMIGDFVDDNVRTQMERVNGVSEVRLNSGAERQLQINVDAARLAQRGLGLTDVRDAIRRRNVDVSAGDLDDARRRYLVRTVGRFESEQDILDLIVGRRNGTDIRLSDVAEVTMDHFEVRRVTYANGSPSISLSVRREPGSNVIDIKYALLDVVETLRRDVLEPNGLEITVVGDDVRYVESSVRNVVKNLLLGAGLAAAVLFLFLRTWRGTLIGLMGMPVCIIAAFIGLLMFGRTINVISLAGIAFAIGMTVDNTIVVLESIEQARRRGLAPRDAAVAGVRDVWTAVVASSATTILVFTPVLLVREEAGQIYSDIAIAISVSIFASMLFALAVVPAACAHFGIGGKVGGAGAAARPRLLQAVDWVTGTATRRAATLVLTVLLTLVAALWLMPPAEYLPEGEEPKAFSTLTPPPGYSLSAMMQIHDEINVILAAATAAEPEAYDRGEAPIPALAYYMLRTGAGQLWVLSEPKRGGDVDAMMASLTDVFATYDGMRAYSGRGSIISSAQGGTRAVNLDISGPNMEALYRIGNSAYGRAQQLFAGPQIRSRPSSLSLDQPLLQVKPRWERLSEVGFTAQDFGFSVASLSDGAFVDEYFVDDDKVDIFLFSGAGQEQTPDRLAFQPLLTPQGTIVPLNALADIVETQDSSSLRRINGRRTVTLSIVAPRDVALETALQRIRGEMLPAMQAAGEIDPGVNITISGAADQLDATRDSLTENLLIAVILIYLLLVAILSHWGFPLVILATVPLGIAGGLVGLVCINGLGAGLQALGLAGINQPFDMITMLGFVILLGTVVNNPILIVEQARRNLAAHDCSIEAAVMHAVETRLRPILMSTATTVFGLAPLVFLPGAGTELYRGIGIVVLAGILISMVVTLTFLPCLLINLMRAVERWKGRDAIAAG